MYLNNVVTDSVAEIEQLLPGVGCIVTEVNEARSIRVFGSELKHFFRLTHSKHINTLEDFISVFDVDSAQRLKTALDEDRKHGDYFQIFLTLNHDSLNSKYMLFGKFTCSFNGKRIWSFSIQLIKYDSHLASTLGVMSSQFDDLTRLPNRSLFADRLLQAQAFTRRNDKALAILFIDLDGFKRINDIYGHEAGDYVLIAIANRMKQLFRETDTVARLGGDEFCALITDLDKNALPEGFLDRLLEVIRKPISYHDVFLKVTGSIGVTLYPQLEELDPDQLLRQADQAMYKAKQSGKNGYYLFNQELDRKERYQNKLINEIRTALRDEEFTLYYQPKINLKSQKVVGVEALIRWHHPSRGLLTAADFISYAANNTLDIEIGDWVIEQALQKLHHWQEMGLDLSVSVNITIEHLTSSNFIEKLTKLIQNHPIRKDGLLELEIKETSRIENFQLVNQCLKQCRALGIGITFDNFGTGYLSLSCLWQMPAGRIKIDPSFIRDMLTNTDDLAIVKAAIGIATGFGRHIVASGIESKEVADELLLQGCEEGEGYSIARPMPPDSIPDWIKHWIESSNSIS